MAQSATSSALNSQFSTGAPVTLDSPTGSTILTAEDGIGTQAYTVPVSRAAASAPVVLGVSVSSPGSAYDTAGDVLSFGVTFDQAVTVTGAPSLSLDLDGSSRSASYAHGSGTNALFFRYTVQAGDLDRNGIGISGSIDLNGGTIQNAGGTGADLTLNGVPDLSTARIDAVAPTVLSTAVIGPPDPDATYARVDFRVTFSEPVSGVGEPDFVLTKTGSVTGEISFLYSISASTFGVRVIGISGVGSLRLDVVDRGTFIHDEAGNPMTGAFTSGTPYTHGGSTDAQLSALVPSAGTLDPSFAAGTFDYTVAVANSVEAISLTPTAADANATITVDGQPVTSGSASQAIALSVGSTTVPIIVTAQDGATTQIYTVTVIRTASDNADLSGLTPSAGTLDPSFDPTMTSYSIAVANSVEMITLTPTAADTGATITVNGRTVTSGTASLALALSVGSTAIPVIVTAADGSTTKTYSVIVTREASGDADLSDLTTSAGALDPSFVPDTLRYTIAVDSKVEGISFTPTAADPNATITVNGQTVNSGSASPAIPLAIGANTIAVAVTTADGGTTQTYTVVVDRAAPSNAELVGLVSSAGTLDPAFDANTFSYTIAVGKEVEMLTLTPTAAEPNAAITVNGQTVASGTASPSVALPVGSISIPVVVTAQDGTTTLTYSVSVERAPSVPTVASRTIEIYAGDTASVELTEGATGGPFTAAAIVDVSETEAGASRIEADGVSYRLVFESDPTYAGTSSVRYTLSNAADTSAPGTITFNVLARPDPSQDPEVIGLLAAQVDAAKRFAQVQTRNFNDRLEQLHEEGERRENSINIRLSYMEEQDPGDREIQELIGNAHNVITGNSDAEHNPGFLGYGPHGLGGSGVSAAAEAPYSQPSSDEGGVNLGDYAVWSGGFVNFGERDGTIDLDYTSVGVSGGIDYRFSSQFIGGFGVGYSRDKTDVGENGTESSSNAYSAAFYGSYKPFENFFLDGLIGGSRLEFDSTRYVSSTGDFATGSRSGHQLFGSLTAAYEFRDDIWLVSPYGRVEFSRSWLDGFTEDGGMFALRYGNQHVDTLSGVLGLRADYTFVRDWGTLTPGVRVEYTNDFAGSSRVDLGYADLDGLPYAFEIDTSAQSYTTLGLSLEADLPQDWSAGFNYRTAFGSDSQDHAIGLEISKRF